MHNLKLFVFASAALLGSSMIGTAATTAPNGLPLASKQVSANTQDARYQPNHWWQGAGWHRWGPWGWRRRWHGAKQGANNRAD